MNTNENVSAALENLRADIRGLGDRIRAVETTITIVQTERAHMSGQVDAVQSDIKEMRGYFSKVAMTIIGALLVAMVSFIVAGGLAVDK